MSTAGAHIGGFWLGRLGHGYSKPKCTGLYVNADFPFNWRKHLGGVPNPSCSVHFIVAFFCVLFSLI
jgi:hypothetical protein